MHRFIVILLLVFGLSWQKGYAQQLAWEQALDYQPPSVSVVGYLHSLANGDFLVSGAKSNRSYPFIYSRLQANGAVVYQRTGRTLFTLEQGVVPLAGRNGSSLLAASVPVWATAGNYMTSRLFFQRIRPNGDTLPGLSYSLSFLEGYPHRARGRQRARAYLCRGQPESGAVRPAEHRHGGARAALPHARLWQRLPLRPAAHRPRWLAASG